MVTDIGIPPTGHSDANYQTDDPAESIALSPMSEFVVHARCEAHLVHKYIEVEHFATPQPDTISDIELLAIGLTGHNVRGRLAIPGTEPTPLDPTSTTSMEKVFVGLLSGIDLEQDAVTINILQYLSQHLRQPNMHTFIRLVVGKLGRFFSGENLDNDSAGLSNADRFQMLRVVGAVVDSTHEAFAKLIDSDAELPFFSQYLFEQYRQSVWDGRRGRLDMINGRQI